MNRIIVVYGHAQCGKSRSINYVRELLRKNGESVSSNPPYDGDRCETFRYKGKIVCVCPGGDTKEIVAANFQYAIRKNADVIITGCRSKGSPVYMVEKYAKMYEIEAEWYRKSVEYYLSEETQDYCNREFGLYIFNKI